MSVSTSVAAIRSPLTRRLLDDPILPTLLRLAWPNVVVMVMQSSVGLIEAYFVGKLGTEALAGVTLVLCSAHESEHLGYVRHPERR